MLKKLSMDRQAGVPTETLEQFSSSLAGFTEAAIEIACARLGESEIGAYETRWPEKAKFLQACRDAEQELREPSAKKPYCRECENDYGILWFDQMYRGNRLRGAQIVSAGPGGRFGCKCSCGGSYRHSRPEAHYSMADVMRLVAERKQMRDAGQHVPPVSEME